ncbi:hypothetical protein [Canibacter zhoujuaniae]|uniref:hypothetical protein n=1 Tax=Canibacter zhoujuaniae TaxID=2708343 RepID=UPI001421B5E5|nr:hypothetical protein [Canibacter zhoujuaniae]
MLASEDQALFDALEDAQPKYATLPTPGAKHYLAQVEAVAKILGKPLIPWQRLAARIITERDPVDPTRWRYQRVIITTPRQVGKTTGNAAIQTAKCLLFPNRNAYYTAQTGHHARQRWLDLVDIIDKAGFEQDRDYTLLKGAGASILQFSNGSFIKPFAPTSDSLHGFTPHDVAIDEAYKFSLVEGTELEGGVSPAMQTKPDRQLIIFSTAGNADSTYLKKQVEQGREHIKNPDARTAYLEWSMADNADPDNPASWLFHPGLGHLITVDDLHQLHENEAPEVWLRAYMNTWISGATTGMVTPTEAAAVSARDITPPSHGVKNVAFAFEIAPDRSRTVIAAAWLDNAGTPTVKIIDRFAGVEDIEPKLAEIYTRRPLVIGSDDQGANRAINDHIKIVGKTPITTLTHRDYATACEDFRAAILAKKIILDDDPLLLDACSTAVMRPSGQGWLIDRFKTGAPVPEAIAAVVAVRLLSQSRPPAPKPLVMF